MDSRLATVVVTCVLLFEISTARQINRHRPGEPQLELDGECHNVGRGDAAHRQCWDKLKWAKGHIRRHPELYPNLTQRSAFADFQAVLHKLGKGGCPRPCTKAEEAEKEAERQRARVIATSTQPPLQDSEIPEIQPTAAPETQLPAASPSASSSPPSSNETAHRSLLIAPELPKTPGCYAWIPSGCPAQEARLGKGAYDTWRGDEKGREDASVCKARGAALDHWCGSSGARMAFVAREPTTPGCYAWRPLGCPRQEEVQGREVHEYDTWHGDKTGSKNFGACKARGAALDSWCGSEGTRMIFVLADGSVHPTPKQLPEPNSDDTARESRATPKIPETPGCYAWLPAGCPAQQLLVGTDAYATWRGDEKGRGSAAVCKARGAALDHWCGSSGAQMVFVAPKPKRPGCYAWRPLGCPRQLEIQGRYDTWHGDEKGRGSFGECKARGAALDSWCGSEGTRMVFIPNQLAQLESKEGDHQDPLADAPEIPKTPGCYAWIPSGCPAQQARIGDDAYATWRGDKKGGASVAECKARGAALDHWCGSSGAHMVFVPHPPTSPGCHAWMPFGCPRQQLDSYDVWHLDEKGRKSFGACKARGAAFEAWCGSKGAHMVFIPSEQQ